VAITASGLFQETFLDIFDGTDTIIDWVNDTIKVAMFTNTITPNFDVDTAYGSAPYNANEVSGAGYTAGGASLATKTFTAISGGVKADADDTSWAAATITNARGALVWDDTVAGDKAVCLVNFGADYSVTAGTFTIQWNASGIWTVDLTP